MWLIHSDPGGDTLSQLHTVLLAARGDNCARSYLSQASGRWVDRKFFREQYDQEQILHQLIDEVKGLDSIPEMSRRVTGQVTAALHPERVYLFYREEGGPNLSLVGQGIALTNCVDLFELLINTIRREVAASPHA